MVSPTPTSPAALDIEQVFHAFDRAWRSGQRPCIADFLPAAEDDSGSQPPRRDVLHELIKLDIECRWRFLDPVVLANEPASEIQSRPLLDDYARHYPELGEAEQWPLHLIVEEFRVRRRWGDNPAVRDYLARFPRQAPALLAHLNQAEMELAAEYAPTGRPAPQPPLAAPVGPSAPSAQAIPLLAVLLHQLTELPILLPSQRDKIADLPGCQAGPLGLTRELLEKGWLTAYQAELLLNGRGTDLILGQYLLLERLGEGGTGRVFKARHQNMNRVVAIKVIRRELLTDPELLRRFYREIEVVGKLSHPHVIGAYDAGPIGRMHVLVMEFVEAVDLHTLVKRSGSLPIAQACEYVRQAALGLQHIADHGLAHRDVKPSNLLVSGGVVSGEWSSGASTTHRSPLTTHQIKILDLGLARLHPTDEQGSRVFTPVGSVMVGTPDFLAPEQALDFHSADIRADIYGLGCTLYFLLTGRPPFAGGSLTYRLLRHQQAEPPELETLRPDAAPELGAIVRRMLAKRPEDRYQAPSEVAEALARLHPPGEAIPVALVAPAEKRAGGQRRVLVWSSALLAASLVLFVALLVLQAGNGPAPPTTAPESGGGHGAVASRPADPHMLFADNFDRALIDPAWTFKSGPWAQWDGVLSQSGGGEVANRKAIVANRSFPEDLEIMAQLRVDSWVDGDFARAGIGLATDPQTGCGYHLCFHYNAGTRHNVEFLDDTVIWGNRYAFPWKVGVWYSFKMRREKGVLRGKVWGAGAPEPRDWPYVQTGWTVRTGGCPALTGGSSGAALGSSTVSFRNVVVRRIGQEQPAPR